MYPPILNFACARRSRGDMSFKASLDGTIKQPRATAQGDRTNRKVTLPTWAKRVIQGTISQGRILTA